MRISKSKYQGDLTDREIWDLFRSGSESAFEFIYKEYFDKLYNYGCQFTNDSALVEDTLQELFLELKRRSEYLSSTDNILPYLYSAFRRKIIRYRTKLSRFKEVDSEDTFFIESSIEQLMIEQEQKERNREKLQQAIGSLSEKHREIIYLFYYENLTYSEIQEVQGFDNIKSARNLLYKALKALRKGLQTVLILLLFYLSLKA